jgi:pimeloyl-ACP methyl ester carboxylesterase
MGYSETSPLPRTAKQFAQELHTLLHQANIPVPYVLVGHSLGGLSVRVFAHDYAAEVAGAVLIESMSPAQFSQSPMGKKPQQTLQPRGFSIPFVLARIGLVRLLAEPLGLPPGAQKAFTAFSVTPRSVQAWADEGSGMPESGVQARAVKSFDNLPLIVLSRGLDLDSDWQAMQSELLQLSSNSQHLIAEKSGHNIETDQPEAAIAAIVKMTKQLR